MKSIVNAEEERDIAVINITNALIQKRVKSKKDMEIIKICGVLVDILCNISSTYKPYVTREKKGFKQFLLRFQNALYVTMVEILLY